MVYAVNRLNSYSIGFLETSIIGYILALCVFTINLKIVHNKQKTSYLGQICVQSTNFSVDGLGPVHSRYSLHKEIIFPKVAVLHAAKELIKPSR